jgi:hypothetical protein
LTPNATLILTLCPFSIGAIALDSAGVLGGIIGWLVIALLNAVLYGAAGLIFAAAVGNSK